MNSSGEFHKLLDNSEDKHRQYISENLMKGFQLLVSLLCKSDYLSLEWLFLNFYNIFR